VRLRAPAHRRPQRVALATWRQARIAMRLMYHFNVRQSDAVYAAIGADADVKALGRVERAIRKFHSDEVPPVSIPVDEREYLNAAIRLAKRTRGRVRKPRRAAR
jgi:hypothetical protein